MYSTIKEPLQSCTKMMLTVSSSNDASESPVVLGCVCAHVLGFSLYDCCTIRIVCDF